MSSMDWMMMAILAMVAWLVGAFAIRYAMLDQAAATDRQTMAIYCASPNADAIFTDARKWCSSSASNHLLLLRD